MKKNSFMKSVALGVMLAITSCLPFSTWAVVNLTSLTITNRTVLLSTNTVPANLNSIFITGITNIVPTAFTFFDSPGWTNIHSSQQPVLNFTNSSYTNYTFSVQSFTNTYTNIFGFITNDIFTAMARTTNTVAATNQQYRILFSITLSSNTVGGAAVAASPFTITFPTAVQLSHGLLLTNSPSATTLIELDYTPKR